MTAATIILYVIVYATMLPIVIGAFMVVALFCVAIFFEASIASKYQKLEEVMKLTIKLAATVAVIVMPLVLAGAARAQEIEIGPRGPRVEFGEHRHDWHRHWHSDRVIGAVAITGAGITVTATTTTTTTTTDIRDALRSNLCPSHQQEENANAERKTDTDNQTRLPARRRTSHPRR
jgi:hypothetical protein